MIKKGDENQHLVKIRKNDVEFIEENGDRYVVENGDKRAMTEQESVEFDAEKQEVDKYVMSDFDQEHGKKVITIEKNGHHGDHKKVEKRIKIVKDDKVYEQHDGELFIIENDKKRSATAEEAQEFEEVMQEAELHIKEIEIEEELGALRQPNIEFNELSLWSETKQLEFERHHAQLERHQAELVRAAEELKEHNRPDPVSQVELEKAAEAIRKIEYEKSFPIAELERQLDVERHSVELERAAEALKRIDIPDLISEAQMEKAIEAVSKVELEKLFPKAELEQQRQALEAAREGWNVNQEMIRQSLEVARVQIEKIRQNSEDDRRLSLPH
jgi:hypothetical protein